MNRDDAASINIARLGMIFLSTYQRPQRSTSYRLTSAEAKPTLYTGAGARLLLPVQGRVPASLRRYAGWRQSTALRTSQPRDLLNILSTAHCRRRVLQQALT